MIYGIKLSRNKIIHFFKDKERAEEFRKNVDDDCFIFELKEENLLNYMFRKKKSYLFNLQNV